MRNKFPSFIALVCIFVYAGAVLFGAYRVYTGIQNRRALAVRELDGVQNLIAQNASRFYTEPFREQLRNHLAGCTVLQGIIITGSQGNLDFEKEAGAVIQRDPNPRFIPRFGYTSLSSRPMEIPGSRNVHLYSIYNAVDYEDSLNILKPVLFAILGALLLSFLTMIITSLSSRAPVQAEQQDDEYANTPPRDTDFLDDDFFDMGGETERGADSGIDDVTDDFTASPTAADHSGSGDDVFDLPDFDDLTGGDIAEPDAATKDSLEDDGFHIDDFLDEADLNLPELNDLPNNPFETSTLDFSGADDFQAADAAPSGEESPQGLYSPRSNVGWEAYTRDRLSSELHICASSEQDLVVLLVECGDGVNCDGELYKQIADTAVELFNLKDLTFEYGERGITVIIPNAGLEQGISKAEAFHSRLFKNCPESFHAKNDLLAGLSSRSGRLIEADRLMLEASRALEKAKVEVGSPIVAFKSDPEKYREYLQKESV